MYRHKAYPYNGTLVCSTFYLNIENKIFPKILKERIISMVAYAYNPNFERLSQYNTKFKASLGKILSQNNTMHTYQNKKQEEFIYTCYNMGEI